MPGRWGAPTEAGICMSSRPTNLDRTLPRLVGQLDIQNRSYLLSEGAVCKLKNCSKCRGLHGRKDAYCMFCRQAYMRLRRYGISFDDYAALLEKQGNACAVCLETFVESPHVDHDHKTGKVRGLLCKTCNLSLGHLRDDVPNLLRAALYLVGV